MQIIQRRKLPIQDKFKISIQGLLLLHIFLNECSNIATPDYKSSYFGGIDIKVTGRNVKTPTNTNFIKKYIKQKSETKPREIFVWCNQPPINFSLFSLDKSKSSIEQKSENIQICIKMYRFIHFQK